MKTEIELWVNAADLVKLGDGELLKTETDDTSVIIRYYKAEEGL